MSSTIIYHRFCALVPAAHVGEREDWYLMIEQHGCTNSYESGSNRRARSWAVSYAGTFNSVMERCIADAAYFDNACMHWEKHYGHLKAEEAIRKDRWRLMHPKLRIEEEGVIALRGGLVVVTVDKDGKSVKISDANAVRAAIEEHRPMLDDASVGQIMFRACGPRL
ncbi:hypothetical protein [Acidovorax sp.]|jgi:hypothetical protein|uniref:hypothetical protein n=1 Tax=Acidovorax sp. TaxID=1872122 RepID=UPI0025BD7FF4|nr:hypothetical protein [Acidovorax sp.]